MGLRLYLDDSVASHQLRRRLADADHAVVAPEDVGLGGADDDVHAAHALRHRLILVTKDPDDFRRLYSHVLDHPGVFLVYRDNDVTRDMTDADIVQAIANLVEAGVPIAGQVHVLNHWRRCTGRCVRARAAGDRGHHQRVLLPLVARGG